MLMKSKKVLVVGVANEASIAWAITQALLREGAEVALTYQNERLKGRVEALANSVTPNLPIYEMDATNSDSVSAVFAKIGEKWGTLDGLVHSIAFAEKNDLTPGLVKTPLAGWNTSLHVSAYTLLELIRGAMPLFEKAGGGSVITLSYDTTKVYPNYNMMGIAKTTLEAAMRYAAYDGGRKNVRVNAVSAGPVKTLAARGISGFSKMFEEAAKKSPLGRNVTTEEVGNAGMFLLSPLSSGITGQVLYVDAGQVIMGAPASAEL
ncbi:MAG TPA: enoyl-ACP reductase [Candidatus Sumerlaeota bacterium]|nr:enoyl-ACP reductase [Candidatus Sumerlaeota bacterium]